MAETLSLIDNTTIVAQNPANHENPGVELDKSPFRRIEFHPARKPFTGFSNGGGDGSFRLETLNPTTTSSNGNQQSVVGLESVGGGSSGKKRDASEMENGLDPELSFGITFRRIGAGLENLGNTCFLNSVLQCLTYTEPLAAYLQSGKHQVTCRKSGFCALCAIQKHVSRALQSSGRSLAPKDLVSNLRCISRTFRNSRQEDAHEYMVNLLESMHKCCLPTGLPSESQSAYDRSLVHKIFGGRLRSQVKCMQCNYCSNKFDPFLDLSLEILRADTLYKAFANFTAKEQLDGGAKQYQCQQCKQKVKALKQLTIHKAPNVLTIHLKRFGSHMSGQKIDKKIHFSSTLDLKPFVTGPYDGDLKYTLYGVLVHAGYSTHSGHYYCFVRTSSGMWYSLDDNRVYQVSEKKVFEQKAYMLFYFKDRKNFPSKKTTDVHQKEKIVMNGTLKRAAAPKDAQMTRGISNGPVNGQKPLATVSTERNGFSPCEPKVTQMGTVLGNGSLDVHKPSVMDSTLTGPPKETQMKTGLCNGSINAQKSLAAVDSNKRGLPKETQMNTDLNNGSLSIHKSSATTGPMRNGLSYGGPEETQKNETSVPNRISESSLEGPRKGRNGDFSVPTASTVAQNKPLATTPDTASRTNDHTKEIGEVKELVTELVKSLDLPKLESCSEKKSLAGKTRKKVKSFLKCKVISMKFSSNVLMRTSLNQRKKKKHKRIKQVKNLAQESEGQTVKVEAQDAVKPLVENGFKERVDKDGEGPTVKVEAQDAVKPVVGNGFKERVKTDGAVLATGDLNGVTGSRPESTGLDGIQKRLSKEDLVHMLTRGMEDRPVPRWDEDESTPSQIRERTRNNTIGYIGDEWDEEYDRGKRKKVRISKTEFDGKNPFQDIANERLKSHIEKQNSSKRPHMMNKNMKSKLSRSGYGPFRI